MESEDVYDVIVVGAGPAGGAAAVGLAQRQACRILLVDQTYAFKPVGQRLDLPPNALAVAKVIHPKIEDALKPYMRRYAQARDVTVVNVDGVTLSPFVETAEEQQAAPQTGASLEWHQLQGLLLSILADKVKVLSNHQLVDITHESCGLARTHFILDRVRENKYQNWIDENLSEGSSYSEPAQQSKLSRANSEQGPGVESRSAPRKVSFLAKLIIGADGINSVCRRCIYRDVGGWQEFAEAQYAGMYRISAKGNPEFSGDAEKSIRDKYLKESFFSVIVQRERELSPEALRAIIVNLKPGVNWFTWMVTMFASAPEETILNATRQNIIDETQKMAREAGLSEEVIQLSTQLWGREEHGRLIIRPQYVVPAKHPSPFQMLETAEQTSYPNNFQRPWYHGQVVLVGDAAHGCPPFLGQGSAMAFEDVLELLEQLQTFCVPENKPSEGMELSISSLSRAFQAYYSARIGRVCVVQKQTMNPDRYYNPAAWKRQREYLLTYRPTIP